VMRVVTPIGGDVGNSCTDETTNDERYCEATERFNVEVGSLQSTSCVEIGNVGGDRQTEAIDVKGKGAEVKGRRKGRHP